MWNVLPTATARAGLTRCDARTRGHRPEATLLLLVVLQFGVVAVFWAHARTQKLCLWPLCRGYIYHRVEGHTKQAAQQALTSTVLTATECTLWETQLATYYSGDSPRHQQGVGPPSTASVVWVSELQKRCLYVSHVRHLSACLFHVSASGTIIAAAIANHRRLSQPNPYKSRVSLVELSRISGHFIVQFEKNPTKKFPRYRRCAGCGPKTCHLQINN